MNNEEQLLYALRQIIREEIRAALTARIDENAQVAPPPSDSNKQDNTTTTLDWYL